MTNIQRELFKLADAEYATFQAKLTPNLDPSCFIGVRVPVLREFAKSFSKSEECKDFLKALPHKYYDENLLHSILLIKNKGFNDTLTMVENFLPYIDNWAVCDTLRPKEFEKHAEDLLPKVKEWISSSLTYTCRFGLDCLMSYYLDERFKTEYLELPTAIISDEYYVKMMIAWYYATALAKQWDSTIPYIENSRLEKWTHNKTIQKAIESYRITEEQKIYLRTLKR